MLTEGARRSLAAGAPAVRAPVYVGAILVTLAAAYWPTVRELSGFGIRSDGQFLIVFLAFASLVWARRNVLEEIRVRPFWPALAALLALVFAWLVGQIAFVRVLGDVSVVLMVPVAIVALCGLRWGRALAFPLAFLVFAIPLEQPIAPILAEWTASATIHLLEAVGVAVVREGTYFTISSGRWVVADSCGGVKYLTSCLIVAVLLAPVLFQSRGKRTAFVLGAFALAIVGNWLRAFLTVLGAHLSNNAVLRDDHSTFGWFVYAVLFALYVGAWWRFRDSNGAAEPLPRPSRAVPAASAYRVTASMLAALAITLSGPIASAAMNAEKGSQLAASPEVPEGHGWVRTSRPSAPWTPKLQNVPAATVQSFQKDGRTVDLFLARFEHEHWDAKLVSVGNSFADPATEWVLASRSVARAQIAGRELHPTRAVIAGQESRVVAWQWYWVDGTAVGSGLQAKLAQLRSRLTTGRQRSAWISISMRADNALEPEHVLQAFLTEMGPVIHRTLAAH